MSESPSPSFRTLAVRSTLAAIAVALACVFAVWLVKLGGYIISPLWPAAGVTYVCLARYGKSVMPGLILGHCVLWFHANPFEMWPRFLVPFTYTLEGWLAVWLAGWRPHGFGGNRSAMGRAAWRLLVVPVFAVLPTTAITTFTFNLVGGLKGDLITTGPLIAMGHIHGIVAFGPLGLHLLNGDFRSGLIKICRGGVFAGAGAILMMAAVFSGIFDPMLGRSSALLLPVPLLVIAASRLSPAPVSVLVAAWCLVSTLFSAYGLGPFGLGKSDDYVGEVGFFNMVIGSVTYLISVGSSRFLRQLHLNDLLMEAAGIDLWEWRKEQGFSVLSGNSDRSHLERLRAHKPDIMVLRRLAGRSWKGTPPESWRCRIFEKPERSDSGPVLLESVGRIVSRSRDGSPVEAIGLVQDLSAVRKAETALIDLGHQKAKLRSLEARLNPHFLFNSLNVIRALVYQDPKCADRAVTSLAELLRSSLRSASDSLIPLREELMNIQALLRLARLRFDDRLQTRVRVPLGLRHEKVPPMMLLNLVENAITHGIGTLEEGGLVSLVVREAGDEMHISIRNPGVLRGGQDSHGLGTSDARQRLKILFGEGARFSLSQVDERTVSADVIIPLPSP